MGRRERQRRLQHGPIAHMQVPIVGLPDGDAVGHALLLGGDESLVPMAGRKVSMLIFRPRIVLETTSASAPPSSAARPMATTSPALGESFTQTGLLVAARISLVTWNV